jgi:diacylglycerol kinase (ATP)
VAVVIHAGKTFGGGLQELRKVLAAAGHTRPLWYKVPKSKKAAKAIRRALRDGADLIFVWGGDGMVQSSIDAVVGRGSEVPLAILPAGTSNLLAKNLRIPANIAQAVHIGLRGVRQHLDVGILNDECFAVMSGTGLDAITMRAVSKVDKERLGRFAYFRSGIKATRQPPVQMTIRVDGKPWFSGAASCVLVGNVGTITGGIKPFPEASPVDGKLDMAVVTANTRMDWVRVFARLATKHADRSPFVRTTRAKKITVRMQSKAPYEIDGGDRKPTKKLKFRIDPGALTVCVPRALVSPRRAPSRQRRPPRKVASGGSLREV